MSWESWPIGGRGDALDVSAGLKELRDADSDEDYRRVAEAVAGRLECFCGDLLLAQCDLNRRPRA